MEDTKKAIPQPAIKAKATAPRTYIGPMPPPTMSNLPCGCSHLANDMSREEQDFVIETVPEAASWFSE